MITKLFAVGAVVVLGAASSGSVKNLPSPDTSVNDGACRL